MHDKRLRMAIKKEKKVTEKQRRKRMKEMSL